MKLNAVIVSLVALAALPALAERPHAAGSGRDAMADFRNRAARFAVLATSHIICEGEGYVVDPAGIRTLGMTLIGQGSALGMTRQEAESVVTGAMSTQMAADKTRLDAMPSGAAGSAAFDAYWKPRCASLAADPAFAPYVRAKKP